MNYFIKTIISVSIFFILLFFYMNTNIKNAQLNRKYSKITFKAIELEDEIKFLEIKYNKLIKNKILEEKAKKFNMKLPTGNKIIRINE